MVETTIASLACHAKLARNLCCKIIDTLRSKKGPCPKVLANGGVRQS